MIKKSYGDRRPKPPVFLLRKAVTLTFRWDTSLEKWMNPSILPPGHRVSEKFQILLFEKIERFGMIRHVFEGR